jgi:hypothetical protein
VAGDTFRIADISVIAAFDSHSGFATVGDFFMDQYAIRDINFYTAIDTIVLVWMGMGTFRCMV